MKKKLVSGTTLYTDSTHLKANANKNKHIKVQAQTERQAYMDELDKSVEQDRLDHGKKPLASRSEAPNKSREIKQSTTDKDSGYMVRDNKPKGFFYLDHRTVDARCNIITDVHVTAGNVHDSVPYLARLDRQVQRFGFNLQHVGLDAGYFTAALCKGIEDRKSLSSDQIVDIQYSEFVKNPLDHIKNTYQQLNFDMNIQTENKIQKYLEQDKNILKPEHRYTLDEFGLNKKDIKGQFKEYMLNYDF